MEFYLPGVFGRSVSKQRKCRIQINEGPNGDAATFGLALAVSDQRLQVQEAAHVTGKVHPQEVEIVPFQKYVVTISGWTHWADIWCGFCGRRSCGHERLWRTERETCAGGGGNPQGHKGSRQILSMDLFSVPLGVREPGGWGQSSHATQWSICKWVTLENQHCGRRYALRIAHVFSLSHHASFSPAQSYHENSPVYLHPKKKVTDSACCTGRSREAQWQCLSECGDRSSASSTDSFNYGGSQDGKDGSTGASSMLPFTTISKCQSSLFWAVSWRWSKATGLTSLLRCPPCPPLARVAPQGLVIRPVSHRILIPIRTP